ncbi:MAG: saccharopine dehydrogenase NADP-binding domain-containing protein [Candidatus Micrarchaeia archaeon]
MRKAQIITIIGAGATASIISRFLAKNKDIKQIRICARNIETAKEFVDLQAPKITFREVDAKNVSQIAEFAKGSSLIINASLPDFNKNIMQAALEIGANYQDMCSRLKDFKTVEQLEFYSEFKRAKLKAIINTGVSPGITNTIARKMAREYDKIESIKIRHIEDIDSKKPVLTWSPKVIVDEITSPPLVFEQNKFAFREPFEKEETYDFGMPFGKTRVYSIYGDEVATLPYFVHAKNIDVKAGGREIESALKLYEGIQKTKMDKYEYAIKNAGKIPTPKELAKMIGKKEVREGNFISAIKIDGLRGKRESSLEALVVYPSLTKIPKAFCGANHISYATGLAASVYATTFTKIKKFGVFPPEDIGIAAEKYVISNLMKNGVQIAYAKAESATYAAQNLHMIEARVQNLRCLTWQNRDVYKR